MPKTARKAAAPPVSGVTPSLIVKFASIAVHLEEYQSPSGTTVDFDAAVSLLKDPEVKGFLDAPENAVFLPLKR